MIPFEEKNVEAYRFLLRIEIALRECLRVSLAEQCGHNWRRMLPGDLLKKIRQAQAEENRPQFDFLKLGPLYYLTLGELIPILQQKLGRATAERFGGDCFIKQLENLLGPRNSICHARSVSVSGAATIEAVYLQMEVALTIKGLSELISHPDLGVLPQDCVAELLHWLEATITPLTKLLPQIPESRLYPQAILQYWWGNEDLAGFKCQDIDAAASVIADYNLLPKGVGTAALRQTFCETRRVVETIRTAVAQLKGVTK